ncbi:conserved hypothetical protein [Histoplasma capsulatum var. duboisii H88]|uniref:Uncharacterized protein n=1 Tax=Ajellomyces capsulatus (strain H88) TaxID=544711 RepID=F0UM61_AJEC8|nr:conserved hypothetical protein [Histoplasma capsulatum var. duboisii H88]
MSQWLQGQMTHLFSHCLLKSLNSSSGVFHGYGFAFLLIQSHFQPFFHGSNCRYKTELTESDSDVPCDRHRGKHKHQQLHYRLSTSVLKKVVAAAATNDLNDDTDLKNDTDNEILLEDEDNNYSSGIRHLIACMKNH